MMWRAAILALVGLVLAPVAGVAVTGFGGGSVDVMWVDDQTLSIRIALDPSVVESDPSPMWVLTVDALRLADGVHSWQLHLSPTHASIVVVPNDFLVTQRFTLAQLEVQVAESEPLQLLCLRVPRNGPIPNLIAPGDHVRIHALWIQQDPLIDVLVPEPAAAGSGGATTPAASLPIGFVPTQTTYTQGELIRHAFPITDADTGSPVEWAAATIALLRIHEGDADEIIRYLYREPDPVTGIVVYEFETLNLAPGTYELVIWANPPGVTVRHRIELVPAAR